MQIYMPFSIKLRKLDTVSKYDLDVKDKCPIKINKNRQNPLSALEAMHVLWSELRSPLFLPFELPSQGSSPCTNCYLKLLISELIDTFYYQFAQLCELKALQDIHLKNIVIHKHLQV